MIFINLCLVRAFKPIKIVAFDPKHYNLVWNLTSEVYLSLYSKVYWSIGFTYLSFKMRVHLDILHHVIFTANFLGSLISARQVGERVVKGENATQGQFPYQVAWCFDVNCQNVCGGSILNETTIITAAHCCDKDWEYWPLDWPDTIIVAGELNLQVVSGIEQVRHIKNLTIHPDYNDATYQNDICLLTLDSPLEFNGNVSRIYLDEEDPVVDTKCQVSGWGSLVVGIQSTWIFQNLHNTFLNICRKMLKRSLQLFNGLKS